MEAERCWSHAMQLKEEAENPRSKFHAKRRLAKGALHAKKLLELYDLFYVAHVLNGV